MAHHPEGVNLEALGDLCTPWCIRVAATLRIADQVALQAVLPTGGQEV